MVIFEPLRNCFFFQSILSNFLKTQKCEEDVKDVSFDVNFDILFIMSFEY